MIVLKTVCGQNAGGQNICQICIDGQNASRFWGRVDKKNGFIKSFFNEKIMLNKQFNTNTLTQKYIFKYYWHIIYDKVNIQH